MKYNLHSVDLNWCKFFGMEIRNQLLRTLAISKDTNQQVIVILDDGGSVSLYVGPNITPKVKVRLEMYLEPIDTIIIYSPTVADLRSYLPEANARLDWLESIQ